MTDEQSVEVALFPIPGVVGFPSSQVPLHVFEPRYRSLVKDCVRLHRRIAVCHTKKMIHQARPDQTPAEILNSNQNTYQPHSIFSAGFAEITEVTADGRLIAEITMDQRYEMIEETQTLPYSIARCRPFEDLKGPADSFLIRELRDGIDAKLVKASAGKTQLHDLLLSEAWRQLSSFEYSFKVFQFVRFDPDLMQMVLEIRSVEQRLQFLAQALASSLG